MLLIASTKTKAIMRRRIMAPIVPPKMAFFCRWTGKFLAAIPMTIALSPAKRISIKRICNMAIKPAVLNNSKYMSPYKHRIE